MSKDQYQRFSDRFFQVSPLLTDPGWYIKLRQGNVIGPFSSKAVARVALFNLFGVADPDNKIIFESAETSGFYSGDSRR